MDRLFSDGGLGWSFDEFAVDEGGPGAGQGDHEWRVEASQLSTDISRTSPPRAANLRGVCTAQG